MMHDRFLCRGKRVDNGDWVEGYYAHHEPPLQCIKTDEQEEGKSLIIKTGFADWSMPRPLECYPVDPATVRRCTGLHDKGEKLIFEKDILEFTTDYNGADTRHKGIVYWCDGAYWIDCTSNEGEEGVYSLGAVKAEDEKLEIIGSAHDNPELLGEGANG